MRPPQWQPPIKLSKKEQKVVKGIRTSLNPGSDAKDEYDVLIAGAGSVAESQPQDFDLVNGSNTRIAFSESGRVFRVNDNRGQLFRGATGNASFGHGEKLLPDQWIDERYQNKPGGVKFKQQGATEALAIVAPKITGVLRIRPATVPSGLCLDPIAPGSAVKAAFTQRLSLSVLLSLRN
jgi:hypothetical protein